LSLVEKACGGKHAEAICAEVAPGRTHKTRTVTVSRICPATAVIRAIIPRLGGFTDRKPTDNRSWSFALDGTTQRRVVGVEHHDLVASPRFTHSSTQAQMSK
jgi:hypothetical protein